MLHTEGPLLILAGAGSGKTGVLTHRIAYMIEEKDVNPYNILAITFTNKAAKEMRERVDRLVSYGADSVWVMTFHATCVRILRRYIDRIGYTNNFTIYDSDDQKTLMKDILKKLDIDSKMYKEKTVLSKISNAKDELITPDEMELAAGGDYSQKKIAQVYREYQKQLRENNALDFDDIICKTVELFRLCPDVLESYQERFKYIMVDEYQDTNTAQFKLVSLLAGKYKNLCVVGDDDQSIYKFRGANVGNILSFEKIFPEAKVIKLEQNYRSTQNILDAANAVIKNNRGRMSKSLWTDKGAGEKLSFNVYNNAFEEAMGIVSDIRSKSLDGRAYNEFAVLYRTNSQSRNLEEKFIEFNIPYRIYGGINFYSRKEIKDILAYLKTIDNGRDDLAVRRIINIPKRGIGNTTVDKVTGYADDNSMSFFAALMNVGEITSITKATEKKIEPFVTLISMFRAKAKELSIKELIKSIVEDIKYEDYLGDSDEAEVVQDRMSNINELISKAAAYEQEVENPTLSGFLEEVALVADIDNLDDGNNVVSLMTLHSAKGLEFPVVYLAGMEDGLFPSYLSITSDDKTDLEEERRLCYVGITRAKEELIMTAARQRMNRGEIQMNKTSRFIHEIPAEYIKESGQGLKKPVAFGSSQAEYVSMGSSFRGSMAMNSDIFDKKPANTYATSKTPSSGLKNMMSSFNMQKGVQKAAESMEDLGYSVGDTVRHIKFGEGVVKNIVNGGRDFEVTVEFNTAGTKKMFASFAKLVKIY